MLSASIFPVLVSGSPLPTSNPEDVEFQAIQSRVDLPQRKSFHYASCITNFCGLTQIT
jgi:hypothetical protein